MMWSCLLSDMRKTSDAEGLLLRFLSYRPRSRWEIESYLRRKGCADGDIVQLIDKYEHLGYVNDLEFARMWIRERMRFNPKGYMAIRVELCAKGVEKDIIDQAWHEAQIDEDYIATGLIERRFNKDDREAMPKAMAFLLRRGFNPSLVRRVVADFFNEGDEKLT